MGARLRGEYASMASLTYNIEKAQNYFHFRLLSGAWQLDSAIGDTA